MNTLIHAFEVAHYQPVLFYNNAFCFHKGVQFYKKNMLLKRCCY